MQGLHFPGQLVRASLKLEGRRVLYGGPTILSRTTRPGLIEASVMTLGFTDVPSYFPGQLVRASLKRVRVRFRYSDVNTFPDNSSGPH